MGLVYRIDEALDDYEFEVSNRYTGEKMHVRVDPDKIQFYEQRGIAALPREVCPFYYSHSGNKESSCVIHLTRPEICREFFCCRILITDPNGKRAGRVMGTRHFCPETKEMEELWENRVKPLKEVNDATWEEKVVRILTDAGYSVRR
jgi:Fe-S-cluster containining protein